MGATPLKPCDGPRVQLSILALPFIAMCAACHAGAPAAPAEPAEGQVPGDGAALFYRSVGSGPDVLVMIHGGPGMDMGYMVPDFAPLAEHHYLLFYDQRGGGRSEHLRDDPSLFTMAHHVADLEALRVRFGLARMTLVAHSFGPAVAAAYAIAHPDRVARMIFLGPLPPRQGELWKRYGATLESRLTEAERAEMARLEDAMVHGADPVAACRAYWAIAVKPRVARPELASRVTGDFCSAGADAVRAGYAPDVPLEYDTIEVTSPTHLALVADLTDAPVSELMSLNPALLRGIAPAGYTLHVPKGTGSTLLASLQLIPADRRASWRMHKVASGETLAAIGRRYGTAASSIAAANGLKSASPATGEMLVIPAAYREDRILKRPATRRHAATRVSKKHRRTPAVLTRTASNRGSRSAGGE